MGSNIKPNISSSSSMHRDAVWAKRSCYYFAKYFVFSCVGSVTPLSRHQCFILCFGVTSLQMSLCVLANIFACAILRNIFKTNHLLFLYHRYNNIRYHHRWMSENGLLMSDAVFSCLDLGKTNNASRMK